MAGVSSRSGTPEDRRGADAKQVAPVAEFPRAPPCRSPISCGFASSSIPRHRRAVSRPSRRCERTHHPVAALRPTPEWANTCRGTAQVRRRQAGSDQPSYAAGLFHCARPMAGLLPVALFVRSGPPVLVRGSSGGFSMHPSGGQQNPRLSAQWHSRRLDGPTAKASSLCRRGWAVLRSS